MTSRTNEQASADLRTSPTKEGGLISTNHTLDNRSNPPASAGDDPESQPPFGRFSSPARIPKDLPMRPQQSIKVLEEELPYGELLRPGTDSYERAVFIGNLLYRLETPAAVVQPRDQAEVVEIVNFCRDNNFQLTMKNGGHSYAGYCLNKGGIVMDMAVMNRVTIDEKSNIVTIEGGATWKEVYAELVGKDKANIVIGGQCPSVGVSGFTLGGGLSPFSRSYGLGVDNVTEMTVVTADGKIVTVHDHETDDDRRELFWGLRGGGGGNFGVLVELKSKIHKLRDPGGIVLCGELTWYLDQKQSADRFADMMAWFNKKGCPNELTVDAIWQVDESKRLVGQMTVIFNGGKDAGDRALEPFRKFSPDKDGVQPMAWSDWVRIEEGFDVMSKVYHHHASFVFAQGSLDEWLIARIKKMMEEAHRRFIATGKGDSHFLWDHIGGETARPAPDATPFPWRNGDYVCTLKVQWYEPKTGPEIMDFVYKCKLWLRPFMIDKEAAYINYIDSTVDDWQHAYYGQNYARLQKVKKIWDPKDFFHFDRSIELPDHTRAIAAVRPVPLGSMPITRAGVPGLGWLELSIAPSQISARAIPYQSVSHDIARQSAAERTASLWAEYSLPDPSILWNLPKDAKHDSIYAAIGVARVRRINDEIEQGKV
ncbi:hypothetical protein FRC12_002112 [Ceratobasidium sp. 428]|nr:hypothetical protein FRC12_002112 [Ceratobasidium sp. 428]